MVIFMNLWFQRPPWMRIEKRVDNTTAWMGLGDEIMAYCAGKLNFT